jgi:hypothetical protein
MRAAKVHLSERCVGLSRWNPHGFVGNLKEAQGFAVGEKQRAKAFFKLLSGQSPVVPRESRPIGTIRNRTGKFCASVGTSEPYWSERDHEGLLTEGSAGNRVLVHVGGKVSTPR